MTTQPTELQKSISNAELTMQEHNRLIIKGSHYYPISDDDFIRLIMASKRVEELERENAELKESNAVLQSQVDNADINLDQVKLNLRGERDSLQSALRECGFALSEISTHLDPIESALHKCRSSSFSSDDRSYWTHELEAHESNEVLIAKALSNPIVQSLLKNK